MHGDVIDNPEEENSEYTPLNKRKWRKESEVKERRGRPGVYSARVENSTNTGQLVWGVHPRKEDLPGTF